MIDTEELKLRAAIAQKISKVVADIGWIGKDGMNKDQKYKFVQASDVFDKVNDACRAHGIITVSDVMEISHEEIVSKTGTAGVRSEIRMKITLIDADTGYSLSGTFPGIGQDYGDKSANKAITSTRKYGLLGMLGIPTGEDPDERDPEPMQPAQRGAAAPVGPTTAEVYKQGAAAGFWADGNGFIKWIRENVYSCRDASKEHKLDFEQTREIASTIRVLAAAAQ